jgi:hypothetical protein
MKRLLLVSALLMPLSGCSWFMETSLADFILDDLLGCNGVRNEWPCTASYLGDDRMDFLSHENHES